MKQIARVVLVLGVFAALGRLPVFGANELKLGGVDAAQGSVASVPLTLSNTDEVQGFAAIFDWDNALGTGQDLVPGVALAAADTVVTRIDVAGGKGYMVLGVVVDSNGSGPSFIPPAQGQVLAQARIRAVGAVGSILALTLQDGKYAAVEGGPLLDNLVTVGGLSLGTKEGLALTPGSVKIVEGKFAFKIEGAVVPPGSSCAVARVLMDAPVSVEGYEIAITHPGGLTLDTIEVGSAATTNGADFSESEVLPGGGTLGVVLDLVEPFNGNVIPPGSDLEIARFKYCCAGGGVSQLKFESGVLGSPPKENVVVAGGSSIVPDLTGGTFTCPGPVSEICNDGKDNDNDQLIDCDDPDCKDDPNCAIPPGTAFTCGGKVDSSSGKPPVAEGAVGGAANVCFYYKAPESSVADGLQGLSMAVCFPCDVLTGQEGTFDVAGTVAETAEYIKHQFDNDGGDGDGCEFILGILVDALDPFDGSTLPRTSDFLRVGCVGFTVSDDAVVGQCKPITFCDGADGRGKVPINNLISVLNQSYPVTLVSCDLCFTAGGVFHRGDCNFSNKGKLSVDIADAAASVSFLFGRGNWKFDPPCFDACDCNDDGKIDLADTTCILKFMFDFGDFPKDPGPGFKEDGTALPPGLDPTPDALDCKGN